MLPAIAFPAFLHEEGLVFSFLVLTKGVTSHIEVVRALDLMSMTQHAVSPQIVADRMPISGE